MRLPLLAAALSMTLGAVAAPIATLARMRETGVATMGVREASGALSYRVGENAFAGFHVELCQRVLGDVRQKLGLPRLDIAYRPVSSQNRIPLLLNGSIDIECGSTTNTTQRQLDVAFAPTTFVEETRFAVKADSGIGSLAQIDGKRVSTTTGTTAVQVMRRKAQAAGVTFQAVFGKDHDDSFLLVQTGRADAFRDGQPDPGRRHCPFGQPGRLPHRRRSAFGGADRDHAAQGRPGVQAGGGRQPARDDAVR